jgi:hypothetical protein
MRHRHCHAQTSTQLIYNVMSIRSLSNAYSEEFHFLLVITRLRFSEVFPISCFELPEPRGAGKIMKSLHGVFLICHGPVELSMIFKINSKLINYYKK